MSTVRLWSQQEIPTKGNIQDTWLKQEAVNSNKLENNFLPNGGKDAYS